MKRRGARAYLVPLLVSSGLCLPAGSRDVHAQDAATYTLHAYTNLLQVPALVLSEDRKPVSPVKREQFLISLDQGPNFHPTQMRMEGDDPLSLAVLLDVSGSHDDIVRAFAKALPRLAPQYLHPEDHVSVYAIDCALVQSAIDIPADGDTLQAGMAAALASPGLHGAGQRAACGGSVHLWDAIVQLTNALGRLPGRRVLFVVSNGKDGKSSASFAEANTRALSNSVAIFGLRDWVESLQKEYAAQKLGGGLRMGAQAIGSSGGVKGEELFDLLCGGNGGFVQDLSQREVAKCLQNLVTLLRGRYILEFPRPNEGRPGMHTIVIAVGRTQDSVWTTGVSYSGLDPAVALDPNTVPSSPSPAVYGDRRPLDAKR